MAPELGGSQISALLESVPGIASVLRSPVADAMVHLVRAAAGVGDFQLADARELVQYAVRRGLIGGDEGDQLMEEVTASAKGQRAKTRVKKSKPAKAKPAKKAKQRISKKTGKKPKSKKTARTSKKRAASKARRSTTSKRTKRR